jgi:cytochrome P450
MATTRKYDLYSDDFRRDTYETFARMRADDPILCQPGIDGETMLWFITRHDDVVAVLLDDETFVRDPALALDPDALEAWSTGLPETFAFIDQHMLNRDGDDHRRLRRLATKAFTPRMVEQLRPRVQEIADDLIDAVEERGQMEIVEEYAFPLPITVIAELLGIPVADRERFRLWSNAIVTPALTAESVAEFGALMTDFVTYLRDLFERRRLEPAEDLVSALLQVHDGGDALSEQELFSTVVLLIVAGHETTVNLIANATLALFERPDTLARLRDEPSLVPAAIEECLRYDSPVERTLNRWAARDVELGGHRIRRGDGIIAIIGSANRDPDRFPEPDSLDLEREDKKHIAFGRGSHYCLGAPLARLEGEIAIATLLRRLPDLRLAVPREELTWRPVPLFRALAALPVAWTPGG